MNNNDHTPKDLPILTSEEKAILLVEARRSIELTVLKSSLLPKQEVAVGSPLLTPYGAFVTITIDGELQGCIGHITARKSLIREIGDIAGQAAIADPRFFPLQPNELDKIKLEITVLGPFRQVHSPKEIIVGQHGILVQDRSHRGLLLPQVATERGWDSERFLSATCQKAGLPADYWSRGELEILVFTAIHFSEESK